MNSTKDGTSQTAQSLMQMKKQITTQSVQGLTKAQAGTLNQ
jgi:hypothetical protein